MDPIDGTTNFVHKNPGFCVSIGVLHNKRPVVGVVYEVFGDNLYWAVEGMGAYRNGESLSVTDCDKLEKCLLMTEVSCSVFQKSQMAKCWIKQQNSWLQIRLGLVFRLFP